MDTPERLPLDRAIETTALRLALIAATPVPGRIRDFALDRLMAGFVARHRREAVRLRELPPGTLLIAPTDLSRAFLFQVGPRLSLRLADGRTPVDAAIRGHLATLLDLMEGRIDGDAAFFARGILIEGDMELVLGVRNVLDGAGLSLADAAGPLAPLATRLRDAVRRVDAFRAAPERG